MYRRGGLLNNWIPRKTLEILIYCCEIHQGVCHLRPSTWGCWSLLSFLSPWLPISTTEHSVCMRHWVTLDKSVGCHGLNACVLPKFICGNLIPRVMILGGGTIGKWIGHEGRAHMNGIRALVKEAWKYLLIPSIQWYVLEEAHTHWTMLAPWSWTSSLQNSDK